MSSRTQVSFASCNLYNLNLPNLSMYGNSSGWSQTQYDNKIAWTSGMLKSLKADVWGFQELWHKEALKEAFSEPGLRSRYRLLVPENHGGGRIICAGAVKKEILVGEPEWIKDFPSKFKLGSGGDDPQTSAIDVNTSSFSRPLLRFQIRPRSNGKKISVYVVHLKSKLPSRVSGEDWYRSDRAYYKNHTTGLGAALATIRRTVEAAALRMILTDEMKSNENPVVVLGDLNDSQHSNTLNIITAQPGFLLSGRKGGSDTGLYSTGTMQEYRSLRDVYYTHIHNNVRESLDHILVSEQFYDHSKKRLWAFKQMDVFNDHLSHSGLDGEGASDHGIVKATFEYRRA